MKKSNYLLIFYLSFLFLFPSLSLMGQRKMEQMDRGVVAMPKSSGQMYISWRHFATDPDDIAYNVYYRTSLAGEPTKLNQEPIRNSTNYTANLSTSGANYTFTVKSVLNGVEKDEPGSFTVPRSTVVSRIVRDFKFQPLPAGHPSMMMKFCWVADLNGDGKYDFVLDRQNYGAVTEDGEGGNADFTSAKVETYTNEGRFMWRVDMGINIKICNGHNDMVTAYDMDGDGKAEVLMMVSEGTTFADGKVVTGADGKITDYRNRTGSAPQWLSIVNGETGVEMDRMELPFFEDLKGNRTDSWKNIGGHFVIAYLDGINPSLIYQYKNRFKDDAFYGAHAAWRYIDGKLVLQWTNRSQPGEADFHQVRVADVDGDGRDEFVEGGYVLNHDGSTLNHHQGIVHGDRHMLGDIDPDRPGLEHFVIQQDNPKTLGMGLFDVKTGETIKGVYQQAVGDVGRGLCAAFDPTRRGLQFYSTMNARAIYDRKGKLISGSAGGFPAEALWWGGDLSRRQISSTGDDKNPIIEKYNTGSKSIGREVSLYQENNGNGIYYFRAPNAGRAAFWGDILGDWREELIYCKTDNTGFVIISTWDETPHRFYNLMQNPAYRGQATARGYYETADVDFYMATDMPAPPIAPVQKADLYYTGNGWIDDNNANGTYADGKSIMFDIRGGNSTYILNSNMSPSRLWLMNPKGGNYTFTGTGKFTGATDVVKSMQGDVIFNGNYDYTGLTRISEGRLFVNGTLASKVQVDARGVIGGNATLNGGIVMETGLNVEGGRIEPGNGEDFGILTIAGNLELPGRNNLAFDIDQTKPVKSDLLHIQGDFTVTDTNHSIVIKPVTAPVAGELTLVTFTGTTNATAANFKVRGLDGIPYTLVFEQNALKLVINEPRAAGSVVWMGTHDSMWNFQTKNFMNRAAEDIFVPGDAVLFNDEAVNKTIIIDETMPVSEMVFENNSDYMISGDGVVGGAGSLKKSGTGKLSLLTEDNSFTGGIEIDGGILEVSSLKDGEIPSSIGASSADAGNWIMRNATLQTAAQMATNRSMQLYGKLTVNNPTTNNSVLISGNIEGTDIGLELKGKGTLTLQGNNKFTNVTIKEGLLLLGSVNGNRYSLGNAKIILEGGTLRMFDINEGSELGVAFKNEIHVPEGAQVFWDLPARWNFQNKLTGSGSIRINIPHVRSDLNGDWSQFEGTIKFTGESGYNYKGDVRLNQGVTRNLAKADIILENGTYVYVSATNDKEVSASNTIKFGSLSGSGGLSGKNYYEIGSKGGKTTFSGKIGAGSGKLTKKGNGSLTLSGASEYTGATTIEGGQLIVTNTEGSATGSGSVYVMNSATLMGTGIISESVYVYGGGAIMPAASETVVGTLKIGRNLVLNDNAKTVIKVSRTGNDKLEVGINMTLDGTLEMRSIANNTFTAGKMYTIFNVSGQINGSFTGIIPAVPGEGLVWNTSRLNEGIISVDLNESIDTEEKSVAAVYPTVVENICFVSLGNTAGAARIELVNQLGVILQAKNVESTNTDYELDMSGYGAGFYFIRISENGKSTAYKVIKK